ncbi:MULTISPECIES: vWA domain-containing protein [Mycolicibacter]|uniref:Substrate-binding domain-containing protein n=1 Tax=[Mycobacterium] vasticus TaxID=2875777 RepID=A0ABU5Z0D3_9MYCO|nr:MULTISPECIES: substrate-binding domain-containing protein [unclassified Mycolicibacter]MEB3063725.1 substrate-binding domain-containing protein [Mycolicibacter sp. MYC101]MEB3069433.1 substrate-binding domain-containing protein [Mycolicibacter sp. MYC017]
MGRHSFPGPDDSDDELPQRELFGDGDPDDDDYVDDYQDAFYDDSQYDDARYDEARYDDSLYDDDAGFDDADPAQYMRRSTEPDEESRYRTGPFAAVGGAEAALPEREESRGGHRDLELWRRHRNNNGRRGVSVGVVAALVTVIVLVGTVILWRFFGNSLSHRSADAAGNCAHGDVTVAVVADPSIADHLQGFADRFNKTAKPVGDRCVSVQVKPVDSDAVVAGFIGDWPAQLGQRPALWVPGSSVSAARLQASAGAETVSDSRSLVTSPVLLAIRPELNTALQRQNWAGLPDLQADPDGLGRLGLAGWGSLRLALPIGGNGDAAFLAGEAVAAATAPKGAPVTEGAGAVRNLVAAQPKLADNSLAEALNVLLRQGDPAGAPVHAVVSTEQQLFTRGQSLSDASSMLTSWLPPGPAAVADYPTVLLAGSWLSQEQVSAASEFARFARKPDQLADLAKAGFRVEGVTPPTSDVTGFPAISDILAVGDDETRATLANALSTLPGRSAVNLMLDQSMTTDEGGKTRLAHVIAALDQRIKALPPNATVGLWTFDGTEGRNVVTAGPLDDQVNGTARVETLTSELDALSSTSGGAVSFTTLRLVYNQALSGYVAGQANSVLVITAGPHTDRTLDGAGLQEFIRSNTDPQRPVAVNVIDFGADTDRATWQAVAQLSGGTYQNLRGANSPELAGALNKLLS